MVDGKQARELNDVIRYTAWSVFSVSRPLGEDRHHGLAGEVEALFAELAAGDVTIRGCYDVSALRADAELMIWWHAETAEQLQTAYSRFRRTRLGGHLQPVWSVISPTCALPSRRLTTRRPRSPASAPWKRRRTAARTFASRKAPTNCPRPGEVSER